MSISQALKSLIGLLKHLISPSHPDLYLEEVSSDKLSAVIDWRAEDQPTKNEDLFNSLMAEGPSLPLHMGPKIGTPEPKEILTGSVAAGPRLGSTSLLFNEPGGEKDKSSKFKVLFSTLDAGDSDESERVKEDPLSSALSTVLSDEEKQELLVSPLKKTLKSAGIEMAETDGEDSDSFVLRVKSTSW